MGIKNVVEVVSQLPSLLKLGKIIKPRPGDTCDCFAARVEINALKFADNTAVVFEGQVRSWRELNAQANRYAATFKARGLVKGDTVSVMMENRIEFLATIIGLNKLGVIASLINTNLTGRALIHCVGITDSAMCVFGEERFQAIEDVRSQLSLELGSDYLFVSDSGETACPAWANDLGSEAESANAENPSDTGSVTLADTALYVFTSGTTGMPKAALLSNRRYLVSASLSHVGALRCDENDRIYICLPLYHGTGLFLGAGASFCSGASMFLRRKFSASNFLPEIRESGSTCFIYIGELCRYLLLTPESDDDYKSPLASMMGNGLRPDVWHEFKTRFGVDRVAEFYGSSEGNVAFVNLLNRDCTVGMTTLPVALVKYDVDADEIVRDDNGFCIEVEAGEPGLLLGQITDDTQFEGYTDKSATESKILRGGLKEGDAWFNTGDLMRTVDVGFTMGFAHYQFVDRVGDTFRWKSENVSTNEVGEIINAHAQVFLSNVYGVVVPKADGRAGMAALVLNEGVEEFDLEDFSAHVVAELPSYARPVFLRIQQEIDTTGTFKMVKGKLRKEAYDLTQVDDMVCVMKPGSTRYVVLDEDFSVRLAAGEGGY